MPPGAPIASLPPRVDLEGGGGTWSPDFAPLVPSRRQRAHQALVRVASRGAEQFVWVRAQPCLWHAA